MAYTHKISRTASLFVSCRHRELLRAWHRLYGRQHQNVPAKALYRVGLAAHTTHLLMDPQRRDLTHSHRCAPRFHNFGLCYPRITLPDA